MGLSDLIENLKRKAMSCDWLTDRMYNKKSKRAAVSSDTDGNQLVTGNKKRRLVKGGVNKEEEEEEEESTIKREEEIEDDLHQDKDEDSRKPSAVVKEEEDATEDGEGILQLDRDEWEDSKQPPADIKEEEGYGYKTDEEAYGYETDEKKDGEDVLLWDNDEWEDSKKPSAVVKKEVEDEVGHEFSPGEIDWKSDWKQLATREESDDQATYLPDEIASTRALLSPARSSDTDTSVKTGTEQPGSNREEDKSTKIRGYATRSRSTANIVKRKYSLRSRSTANIVKRKYSLRSLSHQNNKKGARSKSLRKEKGSSTSLGEANRSPKASTDEDAFGRGICSPLNEASATSYSVGGIVDQDDAIFNHYDVHWNMMYERLRAFKQNQGHCELFCCQPL
jgi:hypothetical protein